jgi:hypothetical protein
MAARRSPFRQRDIHRAIAAVRAAGLVVRTVEVAPDGHIKLVTAPLENDAIETPLDRWMANRARASERN